MAAHIKEADERLLVEAAQRDPARFVELYDRNFALVYAYVVRRVHQREAAEDLTSEVFHRALANIGKFQWRGAPFAAWLLRIAANAMADRWQRVAREQGNPAAVDAEEVAPADVEQAERHARLYRLVEKLPADQRRVIEMRFAEEKSIREIAGEMDRSEGAIKQLQFRALETLRARMSESNG